MIPQTDIVSFEIKTIEDREVVELWTDFGSLNFYNKENKENESIVESMQKNITFKPR